MSKTQSVQRARERRGGGPVSRRAPDTQRLLDRILDTPHLAQVVPRLSPEVLHRVIERCGLEDCGELVALATPDQLARVFDLDLWRPARAGLDEELDADRFGIWLEILMESGAIVAAQKLAGIDVELVVAALAQHVRVFDRAAVSPSTEDGEEMPEARSFSDAAACEVGNYLIEAKRNDAWDAIVGLLLFLDAEHPDYFHRLMGGCRILSNSGFEIDGLDDLLSDNEQDMFDLAVDREGRRETQGYVTPAEARAFLLSARQLQLTDSTAPAYSPIARAYFGAIERTPPADPKPNQGSMSLPPPGPPTNEISDAIAAVMHVLLDAGVLPQQPRALLGGSQEDARCALLQTHLQFAGDAGEAVYSKRAEELAFLANAILAGCSIQARPFTEREASDAAAAVCNLGLENWPKAWRDGRALPDDFLVSHDLIGVFQVGWTVLHDEVSMYVAGRLIDVLRDLRCGDREIQGGLDELRRQMTRHWRAGTPWRARGAMEVIMILDMPAWATLLGLIDECPVIHAAMDSARGSRVRAVSASSFEFISENSQIAAVGEFMQSVPDTLRA
jgi:hypothetical protein